MSRLRQDIHYAARQFTISNLDIPRVEEIPIDGGVLAFTAAVAVGTGVLAGLLPAWQASRADVNEALQEGARGSAAPGARSRRTLIVAEVALALVLVAGATLMVRSFVALRSGQLGFEPQTAPFPRCVPRASDPVEALRHE